MRDTPEGVGLMADWPRFLLLVEVRAVRAREGMPPPAPAMIRLRQALKQLRRVFGVACVSIEPAGADEVPGRGVGCDRAEPSKPGGQHDSSVA
jgi:hypothetical protein